MIEAGLVGWYLLACSAVPHRDAWTFVLGLCTLSSCHCCFPASAGTIIKHATHEVIVTGHFNFGAAHGMTCFEPCKLFNHHLHQGFCCFNITLCSVPVKPMPTCRSKYVDEEIPGKGQPGRRKALQSLYEKNRYWGSSISKIETETHLVKTIVRCYLLPGVSKDQNATARGTKVSRKNVQLYLCPISVMICPANQLQGVI